MTTYRPAVVARLGQANSAYRAMVGVESEEEIVTETKNWNRPSLHLGIDPLGLGHSHSH